MLRRTALLLLSGITTLCAQDNVPVNGPRHAAKVPVALVHATVHPTPGETIRDATVVLREDRIESVQPGGKPPADAVVIDLTGLHIWPGLIDLYTEVGMPAAKEREPSPRGASYWNPAIRASTHAARLFSSDEEKAVKWREQGVGLVLTHQRDGIARGTGALVWLAGRTPVQDILLPEAAAHFSFRKGSSNAAYPSSLMGSIALLRQALYDAAWYATTGRQEQSDADLQALYEQDRLPWIAEAANRNDVLRWAGLGREFAHPFLVRGSGDEYARIAEIKASGASLILPLTLPDAFDVEDPFDALEVNVRDMKHWELAPFNAARLHAAGIPFCFTADGLKEPAELWGQLRKLVRCGLDSVAALEALTSVPARLMRVDDRVGAVRAGMKAHFMVTSAHPLADGNIIHETWVAGQRFVHKPGSRQDPRGLYDLNLKSVILKLDVKGTVQEPEAEVFRPGADSVRVKADLSFKQGLVTLWFDAKKLGLSGPVRLNGIAHRDAGLWEGQGQLPGGEWIAWSALRDKRNRSNGKAPEPKRAVLDSLLASEPGPVWIPFAPYGSDGNRDSATVIIRNATVWTNGPQGILRNADVCLHQGRILAVGQKLDVGTLFPGKKKPEVIEIDATGKHLTCGIVDEHSHIAIERGVNEGGQAISAEVRIGDVIDPDNVHIYRQLAGGVTAAQLLHGSANPMGGQSALIKLRWGASADAMQIDGAPAFIKFALGENVKQSNWGVSDRYPQTRMGVEQLMADAFVRARDQADAQQRFDALKPKDRTNAAAPRRDLELDALAEILRGERFISCHSYVQSEILMLMHLAERFGFRVQTFTHVLEGYKVADRMRTHGACASTFSDWWAYKMEVNEAIPYNGALLWKKGVVTGFNSDDAEMARRLNQEAAKAVKYGGVPPEDAWKFVTLNPAKMLRLDQRMGSVEPGKDADIVLWNTDPLSIGARAEMTFVDGVRLYDAQRDAELQRLIAAERERLIAKMLAAKKAGATTRRPERTRRGQWHCETMGEEP